jgi:hypothetical protein
MWPNCAASAGAALGVRVAAVYREVREIGPDEGPIIHAIGGNLKSNCKPLHAIIAHENPA